METNFLASSLCYGSTILWGDHNLVIGAIEVWGLRAPRDPLSYDLIDLIERVGLVDVHPTKISPK